MFPKVPLLPLTFHNIFKIKSKNIKRLEHITYGWGVGLEAVLVSLVSNQKALYYILHYIAEQILYKKRNVKHRFIKKIELIFKKVASKLLYNKKL